MRIIILSFYLCLVIIGVSFAALNAASVSVNLYITNITLPLSVLMVAMLGVGVCVGYCMFLYRYWRLKAEHRKINSHLKLMEREIKNLRSIPLQDQH